MVNRFIIWGVKYPTHSHHFIHLGFYQTLKKLGHNVLWLADNIKSNDFLRKDDFILTANISSLNLMMKNEYYYCVHNFDEARLANISPRRYINLQVMTEDTPHPTGPVCVTTST